jgi:hypothetical protein
MPRATSCKLSGIEIGVEEALGKRQDGLRGRDVPNFRCVHCGEAVRPHRDGGNAAAHFEHLRRNAACPLSDPERS